MTAAMLKHDVIERWVTRLRVLTSDLHLPTRGVEAGEFIRTFADGMGDRRAIDGPILARVLRTATGHDETAMHFQASTQDDAAVAIMKAAGRNDVAAMWGLVGEASGRTAVPLVADSAIAALEAQTELELAAVHGFGVVALLHAGSHPYLSERLLGAVRWLMAEIQPDNATNRPWGVHAFVWAAARRDAGAVEAEMYADTLVHNALVAGSGVPGRMDVFSAILLRDSAEILAQVHRASQ